MKFAKKCAKQYFYKEVETMSKVLIKLKMRKKNSISKNNISIQPAIKSGLNEAFDFFQISNMSA